MPTEIRHFFTPLAAEVLDRYLSQGWRPAGQGVYTAEFLRADDEEIYGCLQVRLPLADFSFKKRHRKLLAQNNRRFRVTYGYADTPDEELLALNRRYMERHPAKTREDLSLHVTGEYLVKVLDTRIVRVYDGDRLVAFSYFDLGRKTAYTKAGIYDPEYQRFSLGIYTMLLEIDWLRAREVAYYHPGYISPGYPVFDYKTQFGPMEYRQVHTGHWLPFNREQVEDYYAITARQLERLRQVVHDVVHQAVVLDYPSFTARFHYQSDQLNLVDGALILQLWLTPGTWRGHLVSYSLETQAYELLQTSDTSLRDMNIKLVSATGRRRFPYPLQIRQVLGKTTDGAKIRKLLEGLIPSSGVKENHENDGQQH